MIIFIQSAGQEYDYNWQPPTIIPKHLRELFGYLHEVDKHYSLVVARNTRGDMCLAMRNIDSGCIDRASRRIGISLLIDGLSEEQARALSACYLREREKLTQAISAVVNCEQDNFTWESEQLKKALTPIIEEYKHHLSNEIPLRLKQLKTSLEKDENAPAKILQLLLSSSFSRGRGIKLLLSDLMPKRAFVNADIILTEGIYLPIPEVTLTRAALKWWDALPKEAKIAILGLGALAAIKLVRALIK